MINNQKIFQNDWLSVWRTKDNYFYAERKGKDSIAALIYKETKSSEPLFCILYQLFPDKVYLQNGKNIYYPSCVTGTKEVGDDKIKTLIKEIKEEVGYEIDKHNIINEISYLATTQSNEIVHTFLVEIHDDTVFKKPGKDGTFLESIQYSEWITEKELLKLLNQSQTHSSLHVAYLMYLNTIGN